MDSVFDADRIVSPSLGDVAFSQIQMTSASPYRKQQYTTAQRREHTIINSNVESATEPHMTVLVSRTDLCDDNSSHNQEAHANQHQPISASKLQSIPKFRFISTGSSKSSSRERTIGIVRIPSSRLPPKILPSVTSNTSLINPLKDPSMQKYWKQRHRLFSKFDQGIRLDEEGWFSATPEQIADHVATEVVEHMHLQSPRPSSSSMTILDAFGGCGGNAIAFAKRPEVEKVISIDISRQKLKLAANNASIYGIPKHKLVFIECNSVFILQFCYRNGFFVLDQPMQNGADVMKMMAAMPPPVGSESCHGYTIGGIDELPRHIDLVFMDPPWGGVDYNCLFGKNGYSLQENMRIMCLHPQQQQEQEVADTFFDSFSPSNQHERKAAFNSGMDETNCINGSELLAFAASAARNVVYDIPKNTNRNSLAQAALDAGYSGNCRLDEHFLNGRLKTVTAYFGVDWGEMLVADEVVEDPARGGLNSG